MNINNNSLTQTYIQSQVARIAGISDFQIDIHQPLSDLGFDSLMAVELRNQLITDLATDIPLQIILENSSVASLADRVQEQLESEPTITLPILKDSPQKSTQRYPLSQGQWGLWFLHQLAPASAAYHVAFTARICSTLNVFALKQALQALIDRHPTLRTTFGQDNGDLFQEIHPTQALDFEHIKVATWDEEALTRQAIEAYQRPFDLASSVLRVSLLTHSPQQHILVLNIHHIAIDGVSFGVLLNELQLLYQTESTGDAIELPVIDYQYTDFVQWQRQMVNSALGEALWDYWQQRLQAVPPLILPADRPQSPLQSHAGASYSFELNEALTAQLRTLAKAEKTTLYTLLLTAFQVLLHRYTGQEDIVVGTPASGRSQPAFAQTVGFFVNMIALRTNLAGNPPFTDLLAQVRSIVLEAIAHQSYPAPLLIERLGMNRDLSLPGLFRASFNLLNLPKMASDFELSISSRTSAQWGDLLLEPFEIPQQEGQNDLVFDVMETSDRLIGICRYSTDLFDDTTIHRMADRFQTVLSGIITNPQQPISQLPILTDSEQRSLMEWGSPKASYPTDLCIHQLFEMQAKRVPDAIAIVCGEQSLTYQQLNIRANQLAHHLQRLGIAPEVRVGICLERSVEMLVAVLAVLKAGGAYVPLDPNYPPERLSFMLANAQATLLLTQRDLADRFSCETILCLNTSWTASIDADADDDANDQTLKTGTPGNLAYIVYTSGSTGKAKGVMVEHRSLVNAYFAWEDAYRLPTLSSHLQMANFSFDVFTGDWVRALCSGAKLVLCPQEWLLEPESLYPLMQEQAIDTAEFGPAVLRNLMLYLRQNGQTLEFMRLLIVGSDAFYVQEYHALKQLCSAQTRLINSYGVSEATIDSTYFEMTRIEDGLDSSGMMPIGRPFANTQIHILDADLQPVPIGITGELYMGGAGLARGYLNRSDLTALTFIIHPALPDQRLYKTGDRARYLSDGTLEYLGRSDTQIKLRGFRIELGEIEAVLGQYPAIQQSVVMVREDSFRMQSLVAYLVADSGQKLSISDLRAFLKQKLPDPMLPSAFMVLESLPLNANGKVDRRALPTPDRFQRDLDVGFVAPRTSVERRIAEIWQTILKLDRIGIHDSFFELGGHSLLATQAIAQLCQVFPIELPLRFLFESPTIAQLGERIESSDHQMLSVAAIEPIDRTERTSELPLSYAQESLWFLDQLEGIGSTYNLPMPLRLTGRLNVAVLEQSLAALVQRHEILRTTFPTRDAKPVQIIASDCSVNLPVVNLQNLPDADKEQQIQQWIAAEIKTPFDLAAGLLLRGTVLQISETDQVLLMTLHHIIADGWSIEVFVRELAVLYTAFLSDQLSPLTPLPIQYADFALWQRRYLQGEVLESLLTHWQRTLSGAPPVLALPTDYPRPAVQTYHGKSTSFELNSSLTAALKVLSQQFHVTLFMTLLAAFYVLLHRYTQQDDLVVGTPIANRNRTETADLIGYFVNILVLRTDLSGNPSFKELLARVYQVALDAYSYQDLPFEKLVEALQPERSLSHTPLFQVMFALHNAPTPELNLPNLTIRGMDLDIITSKFDLTIAFRETESGLIGFVEYNTDLFAATTIERLMGHYQQLLQEIVAAPDRRLSELSILTPAEQQQFVEWNDTQADYPRDLCIHQLFEAQVERSPDAIAIVSDQQHLTYQELNAQANQLAQQLQIETETRVGICLERSVELLVAVLAVLKAGGTYVPLDPNYPLDRLSFMLEDAQIAVVLTHSSLIETVADREIRVVCLDGGWEAIAPECNSNLAASNHLAYITYTSGSTGRAKGVMIEHRSLVNAYFAWKDAYRLPTLSSHLQMASFSFDVFTGDWVRALCSGAKLILCPYNSLLEAKSLYELMQQQQVDTAEFSPAVLRNLMQYLQQTQQRLDFMRLLIVGSDSFYIQDYQALQRLCSAQTRLINSYGVSEATIDSTYFEMTCIDNESDHELENRLVSIGRPLANMQSYILDANLQPVPIGITGELYIGGAGLARGYLNQPELTEQRFIHHPMGSRLYKTGDLACYRSDGTIELLGRSDQQVKLRGFRIELEEIAALLRQHPAVREVIVLIQEDDERLVAYVVPDQTEDTEPLTITLRSFLKAKLPHYMLPGSFVILEVMPLTPNGKIDRKALPVPENPFREDSFVPPSTPIEQTLADLWADILQMPQVGVTDNFFDLGGHSLLATSLVFRICKAFSIEFPLRYLFEAPTIAAQSKLIEPLAASAQSTKTLPLLKRPAGASIPLSLPQQYIWYLQEQFDRAGSDLNSSVVVRLRAALSPEVLEQSCNEIIRRHEILRTVFPIVSGQPTQVVLPTVSLTIFYADLQNLPAADREAEAIRLGIKVAQPPFDLESAPLIRVALLQFAPEEHWLLITMHHIITDGWSFGIFLQELDSLIRAFSNGLPSPLSAVSFQYADFAVWQQQGYTEAIRKHHLEYWQRQLVESVPELTAKSPKSSNSIAQSKQAGHYFAHLSELNSAAVESLSRSHQVTSFVILLAALSITLSRSSRQREILIIATVGNRTIPETEQMMGCFINDVILRSQLSLDQTGLDLMHQLRETVNEAIDHKDIPLQQVIEQTKRYRDLPLMASLTMSSAAQSFDQMADWEVVDLRNQQSHWDDLSSELYDETTPLELYVELSNPIRIIVNYSLEQFTAETIDRLFANYQATLTQLVTHPNTTLAEFFSVNSQPSEESI